MKIILEKVQVHSLSRTRAQEHAWGEFMTLVCVIILGHHAFPLSNHRFRIIENNTVIIKTKKLN